MSNFTCAESNTNFSPLLWNIFQNDLSYCVSKCNLTMYADDHQLHSAGRTAKEVEKQLTKRARRSQNGNKITSSKATSLSIK